jgi:transposase-like protein
MNELVTAKRQRVTWSAEERVDWVRMFEESGKPMSEFCRVNDLPEATLSLWRCQLRGPEKVAEESPFVEVPPAKLTAAVRAEKAGRSVAITVRLAGALTLEIAAGTDAAWLADVLRALQTSGN